METNLSKRNDGTKIQTRCSRYATCIRFALKTIQTERITDQKYLIFMHNMTAHLFNM